MDVILAKSKGSETLIEHSKKVAEYAEKLTKESGIVEPFLRDVIKVGALLHDLGKISPDFQKHLRGENSEEQYAHNVLSALFIQDYLVFEGEQSDLAKELVVKCVLLHHPIPDDIKTYVDNDFGVSEDNIKTAINSLICGLKLEDLNVFVSDSASETLPDFDNPYFYNASKFKAESSALIRNGLLNVASGIIRSADFAVSSGEDIMDRLAFGTDINIRMTKKPEGYDNDRYEEQFSVSDALSGEHFSEINAPTGFGKTMIGLQWAIKTQRKTYWVCPTNEIARSAYHSIKRELSALGYESRVSVGLLIANKWEEGENLGDYNNIVVTNIDNYVRPLFKSDMRKPECFFINISNVIFDEYHQYSTSSALNAMFRTALRSRKFCTSSKTMLLSATPNDLLYEGILGQKVEPKEEKDNKKIKNDDEENKKMVHNVDARLYGEKKYICEFRDFNPEVDKEDFALITNSVSGSQKMCFNGAINYHTSFVESDRLSIRKKIIETHGKHASKEDRSVPVVCTNIISTGIDISFKKVIMCGLPMDECFQVAGRCNRWNENEVGVLVFSKPLSFKEETAAINNKYSKELRDIEYEMLNDKIVNGSVITLSELNAIREEIMSDPSYREKRAAYSKKIRKASYENLSLISYSYSGKANCDGYIISTTPNIRSDKNNDSFIELFVTLPNIDGYIQKGFLKECDLADKHALFMYEYIRKNNLEPLYYGKKSRQKYEKMAENGEYSRLNKEYIEIGRHSETPYILNPRCFAYDKHKGLRGLKEK